MKHQHSIFLILGGFILLVSNLLPSALKAEEAAAQIHFTHHTKSQGLSSNAIRALVQDERKMIWLATADGLNRFDAHRNTVYQNKQGLKNTLSSNDLTSLALGLDGTLWIGTKEDGLNLFDPNQGTVQRIYKGEKVQGKYDATQLPSNKIINLAISESHFLWIGTEEGLAVMNLLTGSIRQIPSLLGKARITSISVFDSSDVWVGTEKGSVYRWDISTNRFRQLSSLGAPVTAIGRDSRLRVWIGTEGLGLFRMYEDGSTQRRASATLRDVTSILSDKVGDLWIGTQSGLAKMDKDSETVRVFRSEKGEPNSLADDWVTSLHWDHDRQMIWIGTDGGGASRISLERYWFPLVKDGLHGVTLPHKSIQSMASTEGQRKVWIGTEQGVFRWLAGTEEVETNLPGLTEMGKPYTTSLLEDSTENLWVGTKGEGLIKRSQDGKLYRYQKDSSRPNSLEHNYISKVFEDSAGRIWVGAWGEGLYQYDLESDSFYRQSRNDSFLDFIIDLKEDNYGRIWAVSADGLSILPAGRERWERAEDVMRGKAWDTLTQVSAMLFADAYLWVGTKESGLYRINLDNGHFTHLDDEHLPSNEIVALQVDPDGILWIATSHGLSRFEPDKQHIVIQNFDSNDGLQPGRFNPSAIATASLEGNHYLLFGGTEGFNPVNPLKYPIVLQPPLPFLSDFEYLGVKEEPRKGGILEKPLASTSVLPIPFDKRNQFAFHFRSLDPRDPNQGFFKYRLHPFETDFIEAGEKRSASYRTVPIGEYTFQVKSSRDGKKWLDQHSAQVVVKITPPWWQTWWFRVLATLLFLGLCFVIGRAVLRSRLEAMARREAEINAERDKAEVALARQLQHALLLERTSRGLNNQDNHHENEIFTNPLENLAEHFEIDYSVACRVTDDDDGEQKDIKQIAHYASEELSELPALTFEYDNPVIQQVLNSESAYAISTPEYFHKLFSAMENAPSINSVLFMGTRYMDRPNGLIALFSKRQPNEWESVEVQLCNALSPQFGMSIAQLRLAEKEQIYVQEVEHERHKAEIANRAKSDFLAKMTHELRTPLNSIIGFTEIVLEDDNLTPRQRELVDIVNDSGDHLLDVINDILDLSKIEAGKIEKSEEIFELTPLLKSVYEMLGMKAQEKAINFEFKARTILPVSVSTDRSKIRQILINLIGNAIKFTDDGGVTLAVGASVISEPEDIDGQMRRRVRLSFDISDTGKGITAEDLPKLFEKYSQTESGLRSAQGTGLGLPIAKNFIELLGGNIDVESEYGEGTTFRFFIECDEVASTITESEDSLSEERAHQINGYTCGDTEKSIKILIAEDKPNNRLLLRKILERAGFEMLEAVNGQEAVECCLEWHPDIILMDEDMPIMRGSEATRKIISEMEEPPTIVSLTAYALEQARQAALEAGCKDFLAKPFKIHEIFSVISRHLDLKYTFSKK